MAERFDRDTILFEHQFWLQIMGDHARFILNSLAPNQEDDIQKSSNFISVFDKLLNMSHQHDVDTKQLTQQAQDATYELRIYKLDLLERLLSGSVKMHLPPTFINHMINELDEYALILNTFLENNAQLPLHPLHYHLKWLPDAAGHAASVAATLDVVEKDFIEDSLFFEKIFQDLYLKAIEFNGYLRTDLENFPAMERLNNEAALHMTAFREFLLEVLDLRLNNRLLGTLLPLMADHMAREECYYLLKLHVTVETENPMCDPTKERIDI
ncbi:MAG: hypothetical protein K0S41_1176 [Anaerocolumna sp.]|nr:hypothetical protein [Anaerocolumna sp.]